MPFYTGVARAISFSVLWGALVMAHFRRRNEEQVRQSALMDRCSTYPTLEVESPLDDYDSNEYLFALEQMASLPNEAALLRRVWYILGGFSLPWSIPVDRGMMSHVDRFFNESMDMLRSIAIKIGLPAQLPESFHAKLPFRRSGINCLKSLMDDLELLTFYSKSSAFLKAIAIPEIAIPCLRSVVDRLEDVAVKLLASSTSEVHLTPRALTELSSDNDLLHLLDTPAARDLTPLPTCKPKDQLLRFGFCQYQFASFLANLSTISESLTPLSHSRLTQWLDLWSESQDIRLKLLSTKIRSNRAAHCYWSSHSNIAKDDDDDDGSGTLKDIVKQPKFVLYDQSPPKSDDEATNILTRDPTNSSTGSMLDPPVILGPDVYKLDLRGENAEAPIVDVIFINGMLGSVFHTWRQHDNPDGVSIIEDKSQTLTEQVNCWPQDWLSREFPEARILGVNANLKPFLWNPICPAERVKRRIDQRALDIFQQLLAAGVGRRPIIWISHSAGGIVTKEVLKLSANGLCSDMNHNHNGGVDALSESQLSTSVSSGSGISSTGNEQEDVGTSENNRYLSSSMNFKRPFKSMPKLPSFLPSLLGNNKKVSGYRQIPTDIPPTGFEEQEDVDTGEDDEDEGLPWASQTGIQSPRTSIAEQTAGLIFLSVPHRGNQSMFFLYQFPMCFALTPEAKQLQNNSVCIKSLHEWFVDWATKRNMPIVNMIENRDTTINRWYSTRIVPFDIQDLEFSEVILLDSDHAEVCKPRSKQDKVYVKISEFIRQQIFSS